jgi:adhesin HecA-like repeat protein
MIVATRTKPLPLAPVVGRGAVARLDLGSAAGAHLNAGRTITQGGGTGLDRSSATLRNTGVIQVGAGAGGRHWHRGHRYRRGRDESHGGSCDHAAADGSAASALPNGVIHAALAINNSAGKIDASRVITLDTGAIDNTAGTVRALDIRIAADYFANDGGTVDSGAALTLAAGALDLSARALQTSVAGRR